MGATGGGASSAALSVKRVALPLLKAGDGVSHAGICTWGCWESLVLVCERSKAVLQHVRNSRCFI